MDYKLIIVFIDDKRDYLEIECSGYLLEDGYLQVYNHKVINKDYNDKCRLKGYNNSDIKEYEVYDLEADK